MKMDTLARVIADITSKVFRERRGRLLGVLLSEWRTVVGEEIGRYTTPFKLTKKPGSHQFTLHLKVIETLVVQIEHQKPLILERISLLVGEGEVGAIRIKSIPNPLLDVTTEDTLPRAFELQLQKQVHEITQNISAEGLREALNRYGISVITKTQTSFSKKES